ncbi:MAG: methyltransferase domain-containing protein [Chthoniobacterales bacterium]
MSDDRVAVAGREETLFLRDGSNDYYAAYFQDADAAAQQAHEWHAYIECGNKQLRDRGISFAFIVVPNKASVLHDLYPLPLPVTTSPRLQALKNLCGTDLCLPFQDIRDQETRQSLFRRNDTHLTPLGNFTATKSLLDHLGYAKDFSLDCFNYGTCRHSGDLGSKFNPLAYEQVAYTHLSPDVSETMLREPTGSCAGLTMLVSNRRGYSEKTALVFGNSFFERYRGWGMMPMFASRFAKVVFKWTHEIDFSLVDEHAPDYVILQTCERFLGKPPVSFREPAEHSRPPLHLMTDPQCPPTSITKVALDSSGIVRCHNLPSVDTELWSGRTKLGSVSASSPHSLLTALSRCESAIAGDELRLKNTHGETISSLDARDFFAAYYAENDLLKAMQQSIGPGKWEVWSIGIDSGRLTAQVGGVIPSLPSRLPEVKLFCNGTAALTQSAVEDPHFGATHWFMPEGCVFGFDCTFDVARGDFLTFELQFDDGLPKRLARQYRPIHTVFNLKMLEGLPDLARIKRVSGHLANEISFLNSGKTSFHRLRDVFTYYQKRASRTSGTTRILDWGVGCGRVARFFSKEPNCRLTGIDIDADNVAWCSANLGGAYFAVDLMPPTRFHDGSFDLIYSCSVLSHLSKTASHSWLEELHRLLSPSGLALLSFNGSSNLATYLASRPGALGRALPSGFFDEDVNNDLHGFIPSDNYYRATFASDGWWRTTFERHFELVAVERAVVSGHQDLAVLRRKTLS